MDSFLENLIQRMAEKRLKADLDSAAASFEADPERFQTALVALKSIDPPIRERLAWTLQIATELFPGLINDSVLRLAFAQLEISKSDAETRAMQNILRNNWIPKDILAQAFDRFLARFVDPSQAIAVRVYSLDILKMVTAEVPELEPELDLVVEEQMRITASPAFLAHRYKKINRNKAARKGKNSASKA